MDTTLELKKYLDNLTPIAKKVVMGDEWGKRVQEIGQKYSLKPEQISSLKYEVLFVMIGMEPEEDLVDNIEKRVLVSKILAAQIGDEVNARVFQYIFKLVESNDKPAQSIPPSNTPIVKTQTPPVPQNFTPKPQNTNQPVKPVTGVQWKNSEPQKQQSVTPPTPLAQNLSSNLVVHPPHMGPTGNVKQNVTSVPVATRVDDSKPGLLSDIETMADELKPGSLSQNKNFDSKLPIQNSNQKIHTAPPPVNLPTEELVSTPPTPPQSEVHFKPEMMQKREPVKTLAPTNTSSLSATPVMQQRPIVAPVPNPIVKAAPQPEVKIETKPTQEESPIKKDYVADPYREPLG